MLYLYMNYFFLVSSLFIAGVFTGCQFDGKRQSNDKVTVVSTNRMLNPIAPPGLYIADPEVRQMPDGRVYLLSISD